MGIRLGNIFILLALFGTFIVSGSCALEPKIDKRLSKTLERVGYANILVSMKDGTRDILNELAGKSFSSRTERSQALYNALTARATHSQSHTLNWLEEPAILKSFNYGKFYSLWITNQIAIEFASRELIETLALMNEISRIQEDEIEELVHPVDSHSTNAESIQVVNQWGVTEIRAPQVWASDTRGAGITIASIDTGVRPTHVILSANYVNDTHSWYDPYDESEVAHDRNGHGTHTVGTVLGRNGFGVAPEAKWIACKGLSDTGSGTTTNLIRCGQFLVCPTTFNGTDPDCSKTPHVVCNSWGGASGRTVYDEMIEAWHVAGIIPVVSAGNSGPRCSSVGTPGDRDVISVGSTTSDNTRSSFSSVGPTSFNTMKPDVSAPGSTIMSADHRFDNTYSIKSGTSMAAPHVVGAVALLLSKNPDLTYVQIKHLLQSYADRDLDPEGYNCDFISDNAFPNHHLGYGRINIGRSMAALN
ncbi:Bacillopeptidase F [Pseudolycoriella hygida]|uniref:Bacillopeptidase F n=1 Tax=Pseudolycoriella hygida TaxID=35572 RepID=A0A9Q0NEV5_9DIPT|nr:Bacillopeptidase F [Pseudolycoriella hygida]